MVEPPVWNQRTGHIVSGHQRISILDELEGTDDYDLQVAVVDMSEQDEKKLNIQLNNPVMQGDFDLDMLGDLVLDLNNTDTGFDNDELAMMFDGDDRFTEMFTSDTESVKNDKDTLKDIKKDRAEMMDKYAEDQSADFYFVVVCRDDAEKAEVLKKMGLPAYEDYVHADALKRLGGDDNGKAEAKQKVN